MVWWLTAHTALVEDRERFPALILAVVPGSGDRMPSSGVHGHQHECDAHTHTCM